VMLTFCPTKALSKVDLPTLGLPTMAIKPQRLSLTSVEATLGLSLLGAIGAAGLAKNASKSTEVLSLVVAVLSVLVDMTFKTILSVKLKPKLATR
jgi:hypothetical protein